MLTDYHKYTELVSELESLAKSYPHLSRMYSVGNSTENRELMVLQISEGVNEVNISFVNHVDHSCYCYTKKLLTKSY